MLKLVRKPQSHFIYCSLLYYIMTKTVSARISNKNHQELLEKCNKVGCTINEWINEAIQYLLTNYSEFDFGDDEDEESEEPESVQTENKNSNKDTTIQELPPNETLNPTVTLIE